MKEKSLARRMTEEEKQEIKEMLISGMKYKTILEKTGFSIKAITLYATRLRLPKKPSYVNKPDFVCAVYREWRMQEYTYEQLAKNFNVSKKTIQRCMNRAIKEKK